MSLLQKSYAIKSGIPLVIREAIAKDAEKLLALKMEYLKETDTIPLFDYEYNNTIEQEAELIEKLQKQPNCLLLVAESNGNLIGNIDVTGSWRKKMQHTAMIGMGIHTKWQNQGIGTLLIQNSIQWSKENLLLKNLWLEVYATNIAGIALYKKVGFNSSGILQNFFLEKGTYIDKIIMQKEVL